MRTVTKARRLAVAASPLALSLTQLACSGSTDVRSAISDGDGSPLNAGGATTSGAGGANAAGAGTGSGGAGGALAAGGSSAVVPKGTGAPGEWVKIDLPVTYDIVFSVLVDPVHPNQFYAFTNEKGPGMVHVLRSDDYGLTWSPTSETTPMTGYPWGAAIDPNPNRNPDTPPTLYTPNGYGLFGLWKSIDGGKTWEQTIPESNKTFSPYNQWTPAAPDVYSVAVLPDDPPNHVLITIHEHFKDTNDAGFGESFDGGRTWEVHPPPAGIGQSHYLTILDSKTWLAIAQNGTGGGLWKTTTGGRDAGGNVSRSAWKQVDSMQHYHGVFQAAFVGDAIYFPGVGGIKRSTDRGETWTQVFDAGPGSYMSSVRATDEYLYADFIDGPRLLRASISDGTNWGEYCTTPADLKNGAGTFGVGASTDGERWYIVSGDAWSGVWRYTEAR